MERTNWDKFGQIDRGIDGGSLVTSSREFSGRLTLLRKNIIDNFAREHSYGARCHHEYDCCGCKHEQKIVWSYKHNQVLVTIFEHFNL